MLSCTVGIVCVKISVSMWGGIIKYCAVLILSWLFFVQIIKTVLRMASSLFSNVMQLAIGITSGYDYLNLIICLVCWLKNSHYQLIVTRQCT